MGIHLWLMGACVSVQSVLKSLWVWRATEHPIRNKTIGINFSCQVVFKEINMLWNLDLRKCTIDSQNYLGIEYYFRAYHIFILVQNIILRDDSKTMKINWDFRSWIFFIIIKYHHNHDSLASTWWIRFIIRSDKVRQFYSKLGRGASNIYFAEIWSWKKQTHFPGFCNITECVMIDFNQL